MDGWAPRGLSVIAIYALLDMVQLLLALRASFFTISLRAFVRVREGNAVFH